MSAGPVEILILVFILFLLLGPKRISNMFRAIGRGVHDFTEQLGRDKKDKELPEDEENTPKRKR